MLKGISPNLSPELLKILAEMGHGNEIVISDCNFPVPVDFMKTGAEFEGESPVWGKSFTTALRYTGAGMPDGCSSGDVFQLPSAEQMLEVTKTIDKESGVLYIYCNYNGDIFNVDAAAEMADFEENLGVVW